ncbi:hypothetical protein G7K_1956-t1 [Saitoella complicata NRRL Y-17804]|uniref:ESCRT-II complex subunit VPS25 n=1 Tax=Saitoella complicata (strain BCRC 22490 / CBS 7301 / JCM 7358 / NBRC 10748 / NRRL Y-17804) TaxID=698492 RepID=A0A0E9ND26_SAICN|nr:hypothetical protein G7K_1956-t1 [Saitoella complicata NRRL Y-17804]
MSSQVVMASSNSNSEGFPWPKIYSFPPFFTRQPTTQTWIAQRSAWSSLLLSHARYHRRFRLSLGNDESIWENKEIGRVVKDLVRKELAEWMVHENQAAYVPNTQKQQLLLYWRKPAEWAELIYKWIDDTAQFNSVLTLYELVEHETEFKEGGGCVRCLVGKMAVESSSLRSRVDEMELMASRREVAAYETRIAAICYHDVCDATSAWLNAYALLVARRTATRILGK